MADDGALGAVLAVACNELSWHAGRMGSARPRPELVQPNAVDPHAAASSWIDGWTRAWRSGDPHVVAALYSRDATYAPHPFRPPWLGADGAVAHLSESFAFEKAIDVWFGDPIVAGDRAAVEYWVLLQYEGRAYTLAGTSVLRFAPDGLCSEHRDYWIMEEGCRPLSRELAS